MGFDWTSVMSALVVAMFGGSGLIATLVTMKYKKKSELNSSLNKLANSVKSLEQSVNQVDAKVCNLYNETTKTNTDVKKIRRDLLDLANQCVNMDRITSNSILTIINGLEKSKIINGTGEKARDQIMEGLESLSSYQNRLLKGVVEDGDSGDSE